MICAVFTALSREENALDNYILAEIVGYASVTKEKL